MTVHVIIPVFNRLALTQNLINCLRKQNSDQPLHILIINDGSTDGTAEWLATQRDIETLNGNGTLFWGGAVDLALRHLQLKTNVDDWVLLINNDTTLDENFIQQLLNAAHQYAPAAIGSIIRDQANHTRILSIGAHIDAWRLLTRDLLEKVGSKKTIPDTIIEVDALSGRGVLFPMAGLVAAGGMRPRALPHYLADYELSIRVRKSGYRILVSSTAAVYSKDEYGSTQRPLSWYDKLFSVRSPLFLPALFVFWWEASDWLQRLTFPLRLPILILFPSLRKPSA